MAIAYSPKIVTNGLVLYLDAANSRSYPGTGTTWTDLSSNNNNGTLVNGVGYSTDNQGGLTFDGTNDYVQVADSTSLDISGNNITLEVIVKSNDLANITQGDGLISKGSGSNNGVYEILIVQESSTNYVLFRCNGMGGNFSPKSIPLSIGNIYNITCVMTNGFMESYVNGVSEGSGEQRAGSIATSSLPLTLGTRELQKGTVNSTLNGTIYIAKVYNRALSAQEIKQNYLATKGRYGL